MTAPILISQGNVSLAKFGNYLYYFFQPTCHQLPERSFMINGEQMAVCVRCFAFYIGGFLFLLISFFKRSFKNFSIKLILFFSIPTLIDFVLEKINVYDNITEIRVLTGLLLGMVVFYMLIYSLACIPARTENK